MNFNNYSGTDCYDDPNLLIAKSIKPLIFLYISFFLVNI
jgi:hypothetical protein